jgi:hypothetical protein
MMLFVQRVLVPAVILIALVGGVAGVVLGCALLVNHVSTLRFIGRMNRWISTNEAFTRLDTQIHLEPPPGTAGRRRVLGTLFILIGVAGACLLFWRLGFQQPAISLRSSPLFSVALESVVWISIAGSAAATAIGAMMIFAPDRLARLERALNKWHSTEELAAAAEKVHTPLEPIVEAYPRVSGGVIAIASLCVVVAMLGLLITKIH